MRGGGTFIVDFTDDTFKLEADYLLFRDDGSRLTDAPKDGSISLSRSTDVLESFNRFDGYGNISADGIFADLPYMSARGWGAFYGRDREEVGGSFAGRTSEGDLMAFGTFMGRSDPSITVPGGRMADIDELTLFPTIASGFTFDTEGDEWTNFERTPLIVTAQVTYEPNTIKPGQGSDGPIFGFTPGAGVENFGGAGPFSVGPGDWPEEPSATTDYQTTVSGKKVDVNLYVAGDEFNLYTYSSYARVFNQGAIDGSSSTGAYQLLSFGQRTAQEDMPTTGTARYLGSLDGLAVDGEGSAYYLTGSSTFDVDFASAAVDGSIEPFLDGKDDSDPLFGLGPLLFSGSFTEGDITVSFPDLPASTGQGHFFGPDAQEVMLNFSADVVGATAADTFQLEGLAIARQW